MESVIKMAHAERHGQNRDGKRHGKYGLRNFMEERLGETVMESVTENVIYAASWKNRHGKRHLWSVAKIDTQAA